jgi:hypothetical protein
MFDGPPIPELQLAPSATLSPEVRDSVQRAFDEASVAFDWSPAPGDISADDADRFGGIQRIASPSLHVVLRTEIGSDAMAAVEVVQSDLASALSLVRRGLPQLPIRIGVLTPSGTFWFAFQRSASPEDIADGLEHVRQADRSQRVLGWDEQVRRWVAL